MNITKTLSTYPPLNRTRTLLTQTRQRMNEPNKTWRHTAAMVVQVTRNLLVLIVLLIPDLLFSAAALTFRALQKPEPTIPKELILAGGTPNQQLIDFVLNRAKNLGDTSAEIFKNAVQRAFRFIGDEKAPIYKDLLLNDGMPAKGEAEIDIYHWSAKALLIYALTQPVAFFDQQQSGSYRFYPFLNPQNKDLQSSVCDLIGLTPLEKPQRTAAFLKLLNPNIDWQLTEPARRFVLSINAQALDLVRDPTFHTLFGDMAAQIDN